MAVFRTIFPGSVRGSPLQSLARDGRAQVSFSVVAVAVLLLAAASGAYFAGRELDEAEDARRDRILALMESAAEDARVELVRWLIHSVATFVVNIGRASNPIAYPAFPTGFFSGLYIRLDVLMEVGTPRMISALGVTDELEGRLTCVATIGPNIPSLGRLVGRDWGPWRVCFGVYLEGVPREYVSGFLLKETGDEVDLWLVKGCVYGL